MKYVRIRKEDVQGQGRTTHAVLREAGQHVASRVGSYIGSAADKLLTSVIGQGKYTIKGNKGIASNSILGVVSPSASQIPLMHGDKGMVQLRHREFVSDVGMTVDFARTSYTITPTNSTLFPWLASLATNFQEYVIMGMVFEFRSLAANAVAGTNAGMGSVTMCISYDVYEDDPKSKMEANNSLFAVSAKPSESMMAPVECAPGESVTGLLYIRQGSEGLDRHFYDFAKLHIITQGASAAYAGAGELWVTYDIYVFKPIVPLALTTRPSQLHMQYSGGSTSTPFPVGSPLLIDNFGTVCNNGSISFNASLLPIGYYMMHHVLSGTASSAGGTSGPLFVFSNGFSSIEGFRDSVNFMQFPNTLLASSVVGNTTTLYYSGAGTAALRPTITINTIAPSTPTGTLWTDFYLVYMGLSSPAGVALTVSDELQSMRDLITKLTLRVDADEEEHKEYSPIHIEPHHRCH